MWTYESGCKSTYGYSLIALCSFVDHDMLIRHFGHGIGHLQYRTRMQQDSDVDAELDSDVDAELDLDADAELDLDMDADSDSDNDTSPEQERDVAVDIDSEEED